MDVDLCNDALSVLGLDPMADPAQPRGRVEQAASRMHLKVRREVCESNHWSACDKVGKVTPEEDGLVPPGFQYVGVLPADYIGLWDCSATKFAIVVVGEGEAARPRLAWCGDNSTILRYSADVPYAVMNPLLQKTCRDELAAVLAILQTEKAGDRKVHNDIAITTRIQSSARDALNRKETPLLTSNWDPANAFGCRAPGGW